VQGFIALSIAAVQPPFSWLILSMHQMLMPDGSPYKLSKRVKLFLASVQLTIMSLNIVALSLFGGEPDNIDELMKEPELAMLVERGGQVMVFGRPGNPHSLLPALLFFYFTLVINFTILCSWFAHSMYSLKKISVAAKSTQTQMLTKKMFEVFYWQLHGSVLHHVTPLTALMVFMIVDSRALPDTLMAALKLALLV
ncbi:hypothetical protein PMAYCL1PPCAC_15012, partial [Pristionchus mayeri]